LAIASYEVVGSGGAWRVKLDGEPVGTYPSKEAAFEAAVAGGIPIIKPLKESLAGERIQRVMGIINGTTNFILTRMSTEGIEFDQALAEAKISEADARTTALAKVPGGTVSSSELEKEHGKLIWSFDIAKAGSKNVTEVQVDAKTGKLVSTKIETPDKQRKEAAADKQEGKAY